MASKTAVPTTHTKPHGSRYLYPSAMTWSTRRRGSVQRSHICTKMKKKVFASSTTMPTGTGMAETLTKGSVHPPKKSVATSRLDTNMDAYSSRKKKEKRMPEYSVWKPDTSSDSASGRSKGARLQPASEAMK